MTHRENSTLTKNINSNNGSETYSDDEEDEDVLYVNKQGQRSCINPKTRFENDQTIRVGWVNFRSTNIICHIGYELGHIAPQCTLKLYPLDKGVKKHKNVTSDYRIHAPRTSYNDERKFLTMKASKQPTANNDDNGVDCD